MLKSKKVNLPLFEIESKIHLMFPDQDFVIAASVTERNA